jgi:hypothetical protein
MPYKTFRNRFRKILKTLQTFAENYLFLLLVGEISPINPKLIT